MKAKTVPEEKIRAGRRDFYSFFTENDKRLNTSLLQTFPEYENCEVVAIPAKYDTKPYAFGFQKDSPYLGVFNYYIKEMREKGSLKQIQKKYA